MTERTVPADVIARIEPALRALAAQRPAIDLSDPLRARQDYAALVASRPAMSTTGLDIRDFRVPADATGPEIEVVVLRPEGVTGELPGLVYAHGGGFVMGSARDLTQPAHMVRTCGITVVSVEYRLSPEVRFPAPVDDFVRAVRWVHDQASVLEVDPTRVGVGGISAGAAIAASATMMMRDGDGPVPAFQYLEMPVLDDRPTPSKDAFVATPIWGRDSAALSWQAYLGEGAGRQRHAAPAAEEDLSDLPPTAVLVCELDPLRDEAMRFADRLIAAEIPTLLHHIPGAFHGSETSVPDAPTSVLLRSLRANALDWGFGLGAYAPGVSTDAAVQ